MTRCDYCGTNTVLSVNAKCSDMCDIYYKREKSEDITHDGYVPAGLGIGGGDYIYFNYCFGCGKIQKIWEVEPEDVVKILEEAE